MSIVRGLQGQIILTFNLLVLAILLALGVYRYFIEIDANEARAVNAIQGDLAMHKVRIEKFLEEVQLDLQFLRSTPPIQGVIRAAANNGIDPVDNSSLDEWKLRMSTIFVAFAASKRHYGTIAFADRAGGELVRIDSDGRTPVRVPPERLQDISRATLFRESLRLAAGEAHATPLARASLGAETDASQDTISFGTPVYDDKGQPQGLAYVTIFARSFLEPLREGSSEWRYALADLRGDYALRGGTRQRLAPERLNAGAVRTDFPELGARMLAGESGAAANVRGEVLAFSPIRYGPHPEDRWILIGSGPREAFLPDWRRYSLLLFAFILISAMLVAGVSFVLTRSITRPVKKIIDGVNVISADVTTASNSLASASRSLSEASIVQAQSVEETSSSLEEISSMTRLNAENAARADALATEARQSSESGSQAMTRMVESIKAIKETADQSARIIGTIDEIAFQTNLLALNAAVEAARAGESGRGFAVVAEEVRNLARRSADAARETSDLIANSREKAEQGVRVAEEVNGALQSLHAGIRKVGEIVREVAAASNEQAQGVEQVNNAVNQIDRVTQTNSSNAELTASSSEQLSSQARQLRGLVSELARVINGKSANGAARAQAGAHPFVHEPAPVVGAPRPSQRESGLLLSHDRPRSLREKIELERPAASVPRKLKELEDSDFIDM